jgi:hypothetical protein
LTSGTLFESTSKAESGSAAIWSITTDWLLPLATESTEAGAVWIPAPTIVRTSAFEPSVT